MAHESRGTFILDLRAPAVLAVSRARHGGRTLLSACVDGVAAAGIAVRVVVGTPQDAALDQNSRVRAVTPDELAGSLTGERGPIVWFNALAMDLDGSDVARLIDGHAARRSRTATRVCSKRREAPHSGASSVGCVADGAAIERLLETGAPDDKTNAEPIVLDRSVIANLDDWASLILDDRRRSGRKASTRRPERRPPTPTT